jgi:hypothetical protein
MLEKYTKLFIAAAISLAVLLIGILYIKNTSVSACGPSGCHCDTRTLYSYRSWIKDGNWSCPSGWTLYNTDHCKKYYSNKWHYEDATWTDTSHWGEWSNWSTSQPHGCDGVNKDCKNKPQYRFNGSGDWQDGTCPAPVDGYYSEWSECSAVCGGGTQSRSYIQALYCGNDLPHSSSDLTRSCNIQACEEAGQCPTECGLPASTVPDGKGGVIECLATDPCPEPSPTPEVTPTEQPSQGGIGGGPVGAPSCNDTKPGTPTILSAVSLGGNKIKVNWIKVSGANDYTIYYGPSSGNYLYSVASTSDIDSFTIEGLSAGCFKLNAVNGCQPGDLSNEVCTSGIGGGNVLGASTMGATGSAKNIIYYTYFVIGSVLTALGLIKFSSLRVK